MCFETFKRIIDEAVHLGTRGLKLGYINEPLLRPDLEQFIRYAKDAGMLNVYFCTNGLLLDETRAVRLIESGVTMASVSIDAVMAETYDRQRSSGHFERVVKNVLRLIELRNGGGLKYPLVRVSFLRNNLNAHEELFVQTWQNKADLIAIQTMNELPDFDTHLPSDVGPHQGYCCYFPFKQLVVTHEGYILPCCKFGGRKLVLGHVDEMKLSDAWTSPAMKILRRLHKEGRYSENRICRRCIEGAGINASAVPGADPSF